MTKVSTKDKGKAKLKPVVVEVEYKELSSEDGKVSAIQVIDSDGNSSQLSADEFNQKYEVVSAPKGEEKPKAEKK